jgi:Protein of unknown function (DUF4236)
MGLRFQRRVRLFPGVRLNFSRSGVSTSIGVRGATMTFGPRGTYANVGLPGSGLSYRTRLDTPQHSPRPTSVPPSSPGRPQWSPAPERPPKALPGTPGATEAPEGETQIRSADVSVLTSAGLGELKRLINEAAVRRAALRDQLVKAEKALSRASGRLARAQFIVIRLFTEKAIPRLVDAANKASDERDDVGAQLEGCFVEVDFAFDDATRDSYAALVRSFEALRTAQRIWDVTATSAINRFAERTVASTAIRRVPVAFDFADSEIIRSQYRAMRLGNVAGRDLQIFPGFVMMRDARSDFGLIEFGQFECQLAQSNFVEEEAVPSDAERVGTTWKRANKDGSRDRRFNDNYQIPILRYGALVLASPTGLAEAYQISSHPKASAFAQAVAAHKQALANLNNRAGDALGLPAPTDDAEAEPEEHAAPAFVAKPRKNLAVDWAVLALLVGALGFGGVWTNQHWGQITAAFAPPPPAEAAAAPAPAPPVPVKHKPHHRRHHAHAATNTAAPAETRHDH